jgi:hypothetical protein
MNPSLLFLHVVFFVLFMGLVLLAVLYVFFEQLWNSVSFVGSVNIIVYV